MRRSLLLAGLVAADSVLLSAGHPGRIPVHALAGGLVLLLQRRSPLAAFVAALALAVPTGGWSLLMMWTAFRAGAENLWVAGAAIGAAIAVQAPADPMRAVSIAAVFALLPLLAGRTLREHERQRAAVAEQERLRERLRIARDMHDALGHRLGLAAIQAAALEVRASPDAVRQLAETVRGAVTDLHEVVGSMRGPGDIRAVVAEFRASGVDIDLLESGGPRELPIAARDAAYRLVQEGLTNAVKHAPGAPVEVALAWQRDTLRLSVRNPAPDGTAREATAREAATRDGNGLTGLRERVADAGGSFRCSAADGAWHISAALPALTRPTSRAGLATAAVMFGLLPIVFIVGVR